MEKDPWGKGYETWTLQEIIERGIALTHEAQEGDALYRNKFIAVDVHQKFVIWILALRSFLSREGYFESANPHYAKADPLREAGDVPLLKGGVEYGDPRSEKSQALLRNIRKELSNKLQILRDFINVDTSPYYESDKQILHFKGKDIAISGPDAYPAKLLATIFTSSDKEWANDEILSAWLGENRSMPDWTKAIKAKSVYHAGRKVNTEIEKSTGIKDFLVVSTKAVHISPHYLKRL